MKPMVKLPLIILFLIILTSFASATSAPIEKFAVLNEYNPNEEQGMGLPTPINTRSYFFDASVNKLESTKNITFGSCYKYDSKNQRFFTHQTNTS